MYQSDRGNYRTKDSVAKSFRHSCLGKLIILIVFLLVALIVAYFTTPTEKEMAIEMHDNVMQCLEANDSIKGDDIDDYVNNIGFILSYGDTARISKETRLAYYKYNRMEIYRHAFYATARLVNNMHPEGTRVGIGAFGLIVPTVLYRDILLDVGPVHKGYNKKIIPQGSVPDTDLGTNPNIQEFHYKQNPDD